MTRREWRQVNKREPCNWCGNTSWCAVSTDGHVEKCMRNFLGEGANEGEDKKGNHYALYFDDHDGRKNYTKPTFVAPPVASPDTRDAVYRAVLDPLKLSPAWRQDLRDRGLNDDEIDAEGFRSLGKGEGSGLVHALVHDFTPEALAEVPGFVMMKTKLAVLPVEGLWIPVRDEQGRIIAIKVRKTREHEEKTGQKYTYFTSTSQDGAGPGSPAHAPANCRPGPRVRVTEGELKATVCCSKSGVPTISIPGATQLLVSGAIAMLKDFGATELLLSWDADVCRDYGLNLNGQQKHNYVASALEHAMHALEAESFRCAVEWWPKEAGKGIDDVLHAGRADQVVVFEGQAAWDRVLDNLIAAKTKPRSDTLTRVSDACLARWKAAEEASVTPEEIDAMDDWLQPKEGAVPAWTPGKSSTHDGLDAALEQAASVPVPSVPGYTGASGGGGKKPPGKKKAPYTGPPGDFQRGDEVELGKTLMDDLRDSSPEPVIYDRGLLWRFEPVLGLWQEIPWDTASVRVMSYAGRTYTNDKGEPVLLKLGARNIKGALQIAEYIGRQHARALDETGVFFDNAPRGIATQDAFVRITEEGEIVTETLTASHRQTLCLPFNWDPDALAPGWQDFYDSVFENCTDEESKRRQNALDEMAGACLFGFATRYQQCLLLEGNGSNGKGTWSKVILSLFPKGLVCSMPPEVLAQQFALDHIAGKRLNLVGEIPNKTLEATDKIKALIAGDPMTAEPKGGRHFDFIPMAGQIWGVNELPPTKDHTHGFYRRFVVVPFEMKFEGDSIKVDLHKELIMELQGIFARCVSALQRLVRRGHFISPQGGQELIEEWKDLSDQVRVFVTDCCIVDSTAKSSLSAVYDAYEYWARQNGHKPMASNTLSARLKKLGHYQRNSSQRWFKLVVKTRGAAGSTAQHVPNATAH